MLLSLRSNFFNSPKRNQYLAVVIVNLISLIQGNITGWLSPVLAVLKSKETPLRDGPLTTEQISWLASSLYAGAALSVCLSEFIVNWIGIRGILITLTFPQYIWFAVIAFGDKYWMLLIARFITGYTAGNMYKIIPMYISDVAQSNIRGSLGSILTLFYNVGVLLGYILGTYVPYKQISLSVLLSITFIGLILLFIHETPQYHLGKGNEQKAMRSLLFYRTVDLNRSIPEFVETEFRDLKEQHMLTAKTIKGRSWKSLLSKEARRGMLLAYFMDVFPYFCGFFGFMQLASSVFTASGSSLTPNEGAMIVAAVIIIGNFCSMFLADHLARKTQLYTSGIGAGVFLTIFATYSYLNKNGFDVKHLNWIPVFSFSMAVFVLSLGITTIVYTIATEVISSEIRGPAITIAYGFGGVTGALVVAAHPILEAEIHVYGVMWCYAVCCFTGLLLVALFLPETKGRNLNQVE